MGGFLDPRAMGVFVAALERGAWVGAAAREAGRSEATFYRWRRASPLFADAWDEAIEKSNAPLLIAACNGRKLQKRKSRRLKFTAARKTRFLAHFAATCDAGASAATAGVCGETVANHLASDPGFAAAWQTALETGYAALEAELIGQQRAAMQAYRIAPSADPAARERDFERGMKLLSAWRRRDGSLGRRPAGARRSDIEGARARLEKKMRALGIATERREAE